MTGWRQSITQKWSQVSRSFWQAKSKKHIRPIVSAAATHVIRGFSVCALCSLSLIRTSMREKVRSSQEGIVAAAIECSDDDSHQMSVSGRRAKVQENIPVPVLDFWSPPPRLRPGVSRPLGKRWWARSVVAVGNHPGRDIGGWRRWLLDGHLCNTRTSLKYYMPVSLSPYLFWLCFSKWTTLLCRCHKHAGHLILEAARPAASVQVEGE